MIGIELAMRRVAEGHRVRFFQDYYGRQWVKVNGGWQFWRNQKIFLDNVEVIQLKQFLAKRRSSSAGKGPVGLPSTN